MQWCQGDDTVWYAILYTSHRQWHHQYHLSSIPDSLTSEMAGAASELSIGMCFACSYLHAQQC